jgi:hypothetical protein
MELKMEFINIKGDKIGRIFACWVIVYIGSFLNCRISLKFFGLLFPCCKSNASIFIFINWMGCFLADHPVTLSTLTSEFLSPLLSKQIRRTLLYCLSTVPLLFAALSITGPLAFV